MADTNRIEELKKFDESKIGVKGLSDSGITTIPKMFIHPPESLPDFNQMKTQTNIPIIDLAYMNSKDHRARIISQVKEAATNWGFFQVINHGISQQILDLTLKSMKSFHMLPYEVKSKYYKRDEAQGVMYTSNNDLYRSKAACWHDSLQIWMGPVAANMEEIPEICRKEAVEWDANAKMVAENVMELLSEGLGLEAGKFKELTFSEARVMLGHCYPYCPEPYLTVGITPHTDPGVVTVLLQDEIGGLQVKHGDEWVDVKHVNGGLIINVGDFLQIISNGEYKSVQHRVLANSTKEPRISIVEFFNLTKWKGDGYYGPLPELLSPEKPPIYRNFTQQEFHENLYSKGIDTKSLVQKIKIEN
ncbi:1-aminocyclopropane-1-carboxylate oxidase homolog 3-like [Mercurialis annua]|uniref:1-aminocyclopropane-1-carboxylate oxidase homolog 3-like n=1 Tax=Mercurialis annua TaxID=3986 RepID=UPI00215E31E8|nr:1-aminocyclopropane-1-carboxylate oxidase homolog 3-like [Mercurialis annua]